MEIRIQVSSLKPLLLTPEQVREAFARMAPLGCRVVQLQWIDPSVPPETVAEALRENGIRSVSVQDFYETVRERLEYYVNLNAVTGGQWLCVSRIPERLKSREGLDAFVRELRAMAAELEKRSQKLCFHPVSADFTALPGLNAVEALLEAMPELDLCLDLYHLNRNCPDMPGFLRRWEGRVCMVHFKDARADTLVPAGQGDTNWEGVVRACLNTGVPYAFVEQETWQRDPYVCLKEAMAWLNGEVENS